MNKYTQNTRKDIPKYIFDEDDLYNIERVLKEQNIDVDAFFKIMRNAKITDRRMEFRVLKCILKQTPESLNYIATEMHKLKQETKKTKKTKKR